MLELSIRNHCLTKNFVPIPPFLFQTVFKVINETQGDAEVLYLEILKEMKDFDIRTKDDINFQEKALEDSKEILYWLFLVITDKIKKLETIICDDVQNLNYFNKMEEDLFGSSEEQVEDIENQINLGGVTQDSRSFEALSASILNTNECISKMAHIQ